MEPFSILEPYGVLLCTGCRSACLPREVITHLRSKHRHLPVGRRAAIVRAVAQHTRGLCQSQADLAARFRLPIQPVPAIADLDGPFRDGLKCKACPYVARQVVSIKEHCRTVHGWANPRRAGGDTRASARPSYGPLPWDAGIWCQRFFRSRAASGWFQVLPLPLPAAGSAAVPTATAPAAAVPVPPEPETQFLGVVRQVSLSLRQQAATVEDREGKLEPNPWLRRVGWAVHLAGQDIGQIRRTVSLAVTEGWPLPQQQEEGDHRQQQGAGSSRGRRGRAAVPASAASAVSATLPPAVLVLQLAWESVSRTILAAQALCASDSVGSAVLFEVNRKAVNVKPPKPFDARLETRTTERYTNLWKRVAAYLFRISCWEEEGGDAGAGFVRPPFRLTEGQQAAFLAFRAALAKRLGPSCAAAANEAGLEAVDRACLDFLVALLDHPLPGSSYDSVLLSALAAVGIRDDGGWASPDNYTGYYSAIIKVARMLVVRQAFLEADNTGN